MTQVIVEESPIRNHRGAPGPHGKGARRLAGIGMVLATIAVGYAIQSHIPDGDAQHQPFVSSGVMKHEVRIRQFDATVIKVRGARAVIDSGTQYTTSGVWVIVTVKLTAPPGQPTKLTYAALRDAQGRTYNWTFRFLPVAWNYPLQPGLPVVMDIAFEVPVAVATELSVELSGRPIDSRLDALARIAIPVTAAEVAKWQATATDQVAPPRIGDA